MEDFRGSYCDRGEDLSIITTDLTSKLLLMRRGDDRKYISQMYWLPADRLYGANTARQIPSDRWHGRGLLGCAEGNSINYSDVTTWFVETVKGIRTFPGVGVL